MNEWFGHFSFTRSVALILYVGTNTYLMETCKVMPHEITAVFFIAMCFFGAVLLYKDEPQC